MKVEYVHNHSSSISLNAFNEKYECDVYIHANLKWKESPSLNPISRDYQYSYESVFICSIRSRLHSKPQIELSYVPPETGKLFESSRIRVDIINLSSHYHRNFQYPFV